MDEQTLQAHRDLWGEEPTPVSGTLSHLLPDELEVLNELKFHGNVRLEQERIEWSYALERLEKASRR